MKKTFLRLLISISLILFIQPIKCKADNITKASNHYVAHITENTSYLQVESDYYKVSGVNEGVFSIEQDGKFEFWKVAGVQLFPSDWENSSIHIYGGKPYFNSGVCPMVSSKPDLQGKKRWNLLYLNGSVKELASSYTEITPFNDGLAIAKQKVEGKYGSEVQCFYINTKGEKAYPHLILKGNGKDAMRPLRNGLRAFCERKDLSQGGYAWGYIDAKGNVVIPAKYLKATDFSEGYAWVETTNYQLQLIDKTGKVILNQSQSYYYSDVVNGKFCLRKTAYDNVEYFDITGKKLGEFINGLPYYNGYAFVEVGSEYNSEVKLIGENATIERHFPVEMFQGYVISKMKFSPLGTAVYKDSQNNWILNHKGDIIISNNKENYNRISGFENFTSDGYALMTDIRLDDIRYKGIINERGELVWLFSTECTTNINLNTSLLAATGTNKGALGHNDTANEGDSPTKESISAEVEISPSNEALRYRDIADKKHKLAVECYPTEAGTAEISPDKSEFEHGEMATLNVTANNGWEIDSVSRDSYRYAVPVIGEAFAVTSDMNLIVYFKKADRKHKLTVECDPVGVGTAEIVPNKSVFEHGEKATLNVTANFGWEVDYVSVNPERCAVPVIGEAFAVTSNMAITVHFKKSDRKKHKLRVEYYPPKGGTVSIYPPKDEYDHNEKVTISPKPNKGWVISDIVGPNDPKIKNGEPFPVTADEDITIYFINEDSVKTPPCTNIYQGTKLKFLKDKTWSRDAEIYAEISAKPNISTPYGDNTYGFITAMIDPSERLVMDQVSAHLFVAPLKICGYQYDKVSERHWMVLEGGANVAGSIVPNNKKQGKMGDVFLTLILSLNKSQVSLTPRHYRLEMLEFNPKNGEFTCGEMQTFSIQYGWLDGGDIKLEEAKEGFLMSTYDKGLPADFFKGTKMKVASKRNDVHWYPTEEWFYNESDKPAMPEVIDKLNDEYRTLKTDYQKVFGK